MNTDIINLTANLIYYILVSIGYFGLFRKSGRKGWYGFVPGFRDYQLAVTVEPVALYPISSMCITRKGLTCGSSLPP